MKTSRSSNSLFISAGDPSGDIAAQLVLARLRESSVDVPAWGLGGERLKGSGQEQLADPHDLAVLGFWEVAKRFSFFRNLLDRTAAEIARRKPSCVMLVDYPGFNLRLAAKIKPLGIPIIYYIAPQVWAWHASRVKLLRRLIDRLLVILPFEQNWFAEHGVKAEFVGHYLLDDIPGNYIASPLPQQMQLALLPGSRPQEVERMLPDMLLAASRFTETHNCSAVVAAMQNGIDYEKMTRQFASSAVSIVWNDSRKVMYDSTHVLTASGTATLEAGIISRPMVICYKTSPLTFWIARKVVRLPAIGLVNLVLGETVSAELLQDRASAGMMVEELSHLCVEAAYHDQYARLLETHKRLGERGASARVAAIVQEYLC